MKLLFGKRLGLTTLCLLVCAVSACSSGGAVYLNGDASGQVPPPSEPLPPEPSPAEPLPPEPLPPEPLPPEPLPPEPPLPPGPEPTEPPRLRVAFSPSAIALSDMQIGAYDGNYDTLTVAVSGFAKLADADAVSLSMEETSWLEWNEESTHMDAGTKIFRLNIRYAGSTYTELPLAWALGLVQPEGYEEPEATHVRVVVGNGQPAHPFPLNQRAIHPFNEYANTAVGLSQHYLLIEDVVLEAPAEPAGSNWTPIGVEFNGFTGGFNGDGHTISGMRINSTQSYQGFFGHISSAVLENIGLIDGSVSGKDDVGGLTGSNFGTVRNSYAMVDVRGNTFVGGLVGFSYQATVENSYATGNVSGYTTVGGLVGYAYASTVQQSYATGNVSGTSGVGGLVGIRAVGPTQVTIFQNVYATGDVSGHERVGGLIGLYQSNSPFTTTLQNSYATGNVRGEGYSSTPVRNRVGGLVGQIEPGKGTVHNSVALNPTLSTASDDFHIGRLVGFNEIVDSLSNNYARESMVLTYDNDDTNTAYVPTSDVDGEDAESTSAYNTEDFWIGLGWDFVNEWAWNEDTRLPILRKAGGEQNPRVKPILP